MRQTRKQRIEKIMAKVGKQTTRRGFMHYIWKYWDAAHVIGEHGWFMFSKPIVLRSRKGKALSYINGIDEWSDHVSVSDSPNKVGTCIPLTALSVSVLGQVTIQMLEDLLPQLETYNISLNGNFID